MARGNTWINADGLEVGFGVRDSHNPNAATIQTTGNIVLWQFPVKYNVVDIIGTDVPSSKSVPIPANATILRGNFRPTTSFAGGTNVNFGLMEADGTAIDADGLDAAVATAALAAGSIVDFDGALIGASVGADDAYFGVTYSGTYTAGEGIVTVEFELPMPASTGPSYS